VAVDWALETLDLAGVGDKLPLDLSQGKRKLLGVARALVAKPKLLVLDEPAAGLDRTETRWLGLKLRSLLELGHTMLLIDHDMSLVLSVCDRVYVLQSGRLIASGTPAEIRANESVLAAYLGSRRMPA
jgi:branched-chain amino acid transport system ATP-binding protein